MIHLSLSHRVAYHRHPLMVLRKEVFPSHFPHIHTGYPQRPCMLYHMNFGMGKSLACSTLDCLAAGIMLTPQRTKVDDRAVEKVMIGYCAKCKRYRIMGPHTFKVTISRAVYFGETEKPPCQDTDQTEMKATCSILIWAACWKRSEIQRWSWPTRLYLAIHPWYLMQRSNLKRLKWACSGKWQHDALERDEFLECRDIISRYKPEVTSQHCASLCDVSPCLQMGFCWLSILWWQT